MENVLFRHSVRIKQICFNAGVKLLYISPYSPDLNPIEEFFAELKAYIRKNRLLYEILVSVSVPSFNDALASKKRVQKVIFRSAGVSIELCDF